MGRSLLPWAGLAALVVAAVASAGWGGSPTADPAPASPDSGYAVASRVAAQVDLVAGRPPHGSRVRTEVAVYAPGGAERALRLLRDAPAGCATAVPTGTTEQPGSLALRLRPGPGTRELTVLRRAEVLVLLEVRAAPGQQARRLGARSLALARVLAARLQGADMRAPAGGDPLGG